MLCFGANTVPWRKVDTDFLKFPFSALYWLSWDGVVCRPTQVRVIFALKRGIHFWSLYTPSFLLIYTLLWCKHSTMWKVDPDFRKFQFSALSWLTWYGDICKPKQVNAVLQQREEDIFGPSIPVASFWCMHSFSANTVPWRKIDPDFCKFTFSAPYWLTWDGVVCRPAQVSTAFSQTRGMHFSTLHTAIFLLMNALLWCKHSSPFQTVIPNSVCTSKRIE